MQNRSVLISIRPKWCELIASGKKTIEVRKTRPMLKTPFKVYIYCTSVKRMTLEQYVELHRKTGGLIDEWQGKVIGEFVCDTFVTDLTFGHDPLFNGAACMSEVEAAAYSYQSPIYGWHISKLVIYDKPKELNEFCKIIGSSETVYIIERGNYIIPLCGHRKPHWEKKIEKCSFKYWLLDNHKFGENIFLTREAAEKALKEREQNG